MDVSHIHHYVPQWYQEMFFGDKNEHFLLDMKHPYKKNGFIQRKFASRTFYENDLYMIQSGDNKLDILEKFLFGTIDKVGYSVLTQILKSNRPLTLGECWMKLLGYMDAQLSRTPRALSFLSDFSRTRNHALLLMNNYQQIHLAMWTDCTWEVFDASESGLEFILSDNPVTLYNRDIYPLSNDGKTGMELNFPELGTQMLFPLDKYKLLVLTHKQFARNPFYNCRKQRINPRITGPMCIMLTDIIWNRKLSSDDVIKINFIIKNRADKYIAASNPDLLFPEKTNKKIDWNNIKKNDFLLPDPRELMIASEWVAGFKDGHSEGTNDYGQFEDDKEALSARDKESQILRQRQEYYNKRYGELGHRPAPFYNLDNQFK